ncbi:hypothetical protein AB0D47_20375 [Streptomyces sp. NPDC048376]|uniref:hypothetical protein n=1 Tax=Streptomyces sp. NPDC048376 TaxID=3154926 RepID=UPI003426D612
MPIETSGNRQSVSNRTYRARVEEPGSGVLSKTIEAAYFATENGFVEFKDSDHKAVYAVRHDCLLSVERVQLTSDTASEK